MTEFNLSEKIKYRFASTEGCFGKEDVEEFIRLLKEEIKEEIPINKSNQYFQGRLDGLGVFNSKINKLAGEKLI